MIRACCANLEITPAEPYAVPAFIQETFGTDPELPAFDFRLVRDDDRASGGPLFNSIREKGSNHDLRDLPERGHTTPAAICLMSDGWQKFGYYGQAILSRLGDGFLATGEDNLPRYMTEVEGWINFASNIVVGAQLSLSEETARRPMQLTAAETDSIGISCNWAVAAHVAPDDTRALYLCEEAPSLYVATAYAGDFDPYDGDFDSSRPRCIELDPERLNDIQWHQIVQARNALDVTAAAPLKRKGVLRHLKDMGIVKDFSLANDKFDIKLAA